MVVNVAERWLLESSLLSGSALVMSLLCLAIMGLVYFLLKRGY